MSILPTGNTKTDLIKKAIKDPLNFYPVYFNQLIALPEPDALTFEDIRGMIMRIYDLNESKLREASDATVGPLGKLNKSDTAKRLEEFNYRIRKFNGDKKQQRVILAEGDSWFMFPVFVTDIIDWLNKFYKDEFAIYSIAYGGDWITNIIYEGTYIEELSTLKPDYFLISGGGNDLVGNNKLAVMVDSECGAIYPDDKRPTGYNGAEKFITGEFYAFINTIQLQYYLMFKSIHKAEKLKQTKIITQGYDYAIPDFNLHFSWRYPLQWIVNYMAGTGKWLKRPLCIKNIPDEFHNDIIRLMIDRVNELFIQLALRPELENLYHIDCRGTAKQPGDWYDELHLKSHVFYKIATAYKKFIDSNDKTTKVLKA